MGGWWPLSHGFFCITSVILAVVNPGDTSAQSLRRINLVGLQWTSLATKRLMLFQSSLRNPRGALGSKLMDWMDSGAGSDEMGDDNRFVGIIMRSEISDTEATSARTL